jgi:hypothetical protein
MKVGRRHCATLSSSRSFTTKHATSTPISDLQRSTSTQATSRKPTGSPFTSWPHSPNMKRNGLSSHAGGPVRSYHRRILLGSYVLR